MSTINDSDLLLVERNGNLHQITYDQMSTLNDDDILLVERGGVQYKVEAQYVSTGPNGLIVTPVEVLTPINGAGLNDGDPYTPMSSAYVSTDTVDGLVTFEFTDDTDLDKMVAPIIMTDANGDVKIPTTSTVDSTTSIPGVKKSCEYAWNNWGNPYTQQSISQNNSADAPPDGPRMMWAKADVTAAPIISDNVYNFSYQLFTSNNDPRNGVFGPELRENETWYPSNSPYINVDGGNWSYTNEIAVTPGVLDIVSWTGDGADLREIPHNLGTKPGMIIIKSTDTGFNWAVWHQDLKPGEYLNLNNGNKPYSNTLYFPSEPTKDAIYLGSHYNVNSDQGSTYVAYIFGGDTEGKVKCGTYTGAGSNVNTIEMGFEPGFFLTKSISSHGRNWGATNKAASGQLHFWYPNLTQKPSGQSSEYIELQSNRVRLYNDGSNSYDAWGETYVYLCVANDLLGPNSTQLNLLNGQDLEYFAAGTEITSNSSASGSNISFSSNTYSGNGSLTFRMPNVSSNTNWFDITPKTGNKWLVWIKAYSSSGLDHVLHDSERNYYERLETNRTIPNTYNDNKYILPHKDSSNSGYKVTPAGEDHNDNNVDYVYWNFLAAPQFFDIQKYVGTGSGTTKTISHDLGVEPGCIITKGLHNEYSWMVYHSELPEGGALQLQQTGTPIVSQGSFYVDTNENNYTLGDAASLNAVNKDFIAYIFAKDTPYVKCGKYAASGNGTSVNVGFKPRWVMIKNITNFYDWMILDKNIPSNKTLSPNTTSQSVALANGYTFTSNGFSFGGNDAETNRSGNEYIYVAIADESEGHPPSSPSTSTVTETPDPNTAQMVVNAESFDVGATASAPALEASITSVAGSDGNTLIVDGTTGTWLPGLYAKGSETTINAPGPDEITFTSQNQGTPAFSGVDATLASRTWTLESGPSATGPWTLVDSYVDYDVLNSQTGATPWSSNKPNLTPNTFYRVKVQYNSTNAESVESVYNTFKTGDA